MTPTEKKLHEHIISVYGETEAENIHAKIDERLREFAEKHPDLATNHTTERVSEKDAVLITYGDMVQADGQAPLKTLGSFLQNTINKIISTVHILPFYPYSSDDGFSVIGYHQVNPEYGNWEDVTAMGTNFRLMFDAVVNHISSKSKWFQGFLADESKYDNYFYEVNSTFDTSQVFRPRALPLLTEFATKSGTKKVWTTFSEDQIDLNYENPDLLLEVIDILLHYIAQGAEFIRLDAIAFIWKESGTRCLHQPQTHRIIQLLRTVLDTAAPSVSLITETNVPHDENISYFGDGFNEAQMVYNFSLPPLTLHAIQTGNAEILSKWAATLDTPSDQSTFFNFLASHDGVGLMPVRGFLSEDEINTMTERVLALGGRVSYKNNPDGSRTPYELNINYLNALGNPDKPDEPTELIARRFLVSQSIMLTLQGVPGIYFHSLFGSQNWKAGIQETGRNRTINRQKLQLEYLEKELSSPNTLRQHVFSGYATMLKARRSHSAFHPMAAQKILDLGKAIFAILRTSLDGDEEILCLHNISRDEQELDLELKDAYVDILTKERISTKSIRLTPYQVLWLKTR